MSTRFENSPSSLSDKKFNRRAFIKGAVLGVGGIALGGGLTGCGKASNAESAPAPTAATIITNPASTESISETPASIDTSIEATNNLPEASQEAVAGLAVEKYSDPYEVAAAYCSAETEWFCDGNTVENANRWLKKAREVGFKLAATNIASETDFKHINALYIDGWEEKPDLIKEIEAQKKLHAAFALLFYQTSMSTNPRDIEPYACTTVLGNIEVLSESSEEIKARVIYKYKDNSDYNRAVELSNGTEVEDWTVDQITTWKNENGYWKIAEVAANN